MSFYGQRIQQFRTAATFEPTALDIPPALLPPRGAMTPAVFAKHLKRLAEASGAHVLPEARALTETLKGLERGTVFPSFDIMQSIEAAFGLSTERQLYWIFENSRLNRVLLPRNHKLALTAKPGHQALPLFVLDEFCASNTFASIATGHLEARDGVVSLPAALAARGTFAIVGNGGCNAVAEDTLLLAHPVGQRKPETGALVLAALHDGQRATYVIRRVKRLSRGQMALHNDGASSDPSLVLVWPATSVSIAAEIQLVLPNARNLGCEWGVPYKQGRTRRKGAA
jgi:hypothetical protein